MGDLKQTGDIRPEETRTLVTTSPLVLTTGSLQKFSDALISGLISHIPSSVEIAIKDIRRLSHLHENDRDMDSLIAINELPGTNFGYIFLKEFNAIELAKISDQVFKIYDNETHNGNTVIFCTVNVANFNMEMNLPAVINLKTEIERLANIISFLGNVNLVLFVDTKEDLQKKDVVVNKQGIDVEVIEEDPTLDATKNRAAKITDYLKKSAFGKHLVTSDRVLATESFAKTLVRPAGAEA